MTVGTKRGRYIPPDINDDQGSSQTDASTPASQTPTSQVTNLPTTPPPAPVRKSPPPKATKPPLPTRWSLRKTTVDALLDFQSTTTPTTLPRRSPRKGNQVEPTPTITPRSPGKGKQGAKKSHTMMKGGFFFWKLFSLGLLYLRLAALVMIMPVLIMALSLGKLLYSRNC
ncbi:hypothetical protein FRX31_017022 [Thalictrum thalictroides]|uniref:Transmembrane protein n=1 Tax=Thalictrum thalictroides TaxID=46969 RepID=A0A7J6W914_THATH|nr:hypothetical protein FRX31_017022 [Thalictrum thalictroides]